MNNEHAVRGFFLTLRATLPGIGEVARQIMRPEGLAMVHAPHRCRYSFYWGETTPAPENPINRDFSACRPNMKLPTDITEIKTRDGKVVVCIAHD